MATSGEANRLAAILRDTVVGLVRQDGVDLSARQLAILLICYLEDGPHRMHALADRLYVGRPAISRCVDRLVRLNLADRIFDPADRRSLFVTRTPAGTAYVDVLRDLAQAAAGKIDTRDKTRPATRTR